MSDTEPGREGSYTGDVCHRAGKAAIRGGRVSQGRVGNYTGGGGRVSDMVLTLRLIAVMHAGVVGSNVLG